PRHRALRILNSIERADARRRRASPDTLSPTVNRVGADRGGLSRGSVRFSCAYPARPFNPGTLSVTARGAPYTVTEVAGIVGISRSTAYECVRRGEIPSRRFGRRIVVLRHELE